MIDTTQMTDKGNSYWENSILNSKLSIADIEPLTKEGINRNYYDGVYRRDKKAKYGSVDNPIVVGIPECSNSLVFILERGGWCLTDGLGNGWIR